MNFLSIQRSCYFVSRNRYLRTTYVMVIWVSQAIAYGQSMGFQLLLNYRLNESIKYFTKKSHCYIIVLAFIAIKTLVGWKQCKIRSYLSMINQNFYKLIYSYRFSQIVIAYIQLKIFTAKTQYFFNEMLWNNLFTWK